MTPARRAAERLIVHVLLSAAAIVLAIWLIPLAWNYLSPFIVALPIAAMLQPVIRRLEKIPRMKHTAAVMIPVVLLLLLIIGMSVWFLVYGIGEIIRALNNSPTFIADTINTIRQAMQNLISSVTRPGENFSWISSTVENALSWLASEATTVASVLLGQTVSFAASIPYALIYLNFLCMAIYFITKNYTRIRSRLPGAPENRGSASDKLANSAVKGAVAFLRMQIIYAIVTLCVGLIYWHILGSPYAFLISLLAGITEMIPLLGSGVVYVPWAVVSLLVGNYVAAGQAIGVYAAVFLIRRFTEPKLLSHSTGASPLLSLIGMFAGMRAGGLFGLIGGPVVMTVLMSVWQGHYLDPWWDDVVVLRRWFHDRWAAVDSAPSGPADDDTTITKS